MQNGFPSACGISKLHQAVTLASLLRGWREGPNRFMAHKSLAHVSAWRARTLVCTSHIKCAARKRVGQSLDDQCQFADTYSVFDSLTTIYLSISQSLNRSIDRSIDLSIYLFVCLSVCLSVYRYIYLSFCQSIYLFVCLSICPSLSIYRSINLFVCLSIFLPNLINLPYIYISIIYIYIYLNI